MRRTGKYRGLVIFFVMFVSTDILYAQFDSQIGLYMFSTNSYNPAGVAEDDLMKVLGLHRMQWIGITNAPMVTYAHFSSPFVIKKTKHGAGVKFLNDRFGLFTNQSFYVQYAYRHKIKSGYLCVGADFGFVNVGFKGDSVNLKNLGAETDGSEYFMESDRAIPTSSKSGMSFDMDLGAYYYSSTFWGGISYTHVTRPKVRWDEYNRVTLIGTMYATFGYNHRFKYSNKWAIKPSMMLMSDFRSWDLNVSLLCEYISRFRWGLGYRILGSVNVLVSIDIISGLHLGYTFEIPHNSLMLESAGNHEVILSYGFNILRPKSTNRYKSIRFL